MKILSLESSAVSAAVCLTEGEKLIAASFQNCGLTHSRTLLPMVQNLLESAGMSIADVDAFAVAAGPGSFTGIRIGAATVKGLALGTGKPCLGVSTLEAMARGLAGTDGVIDCVMDARAGQVYHARFRAENGMLERLCPDRAVTIAELGEEIGAEPEILVGDGAELCYNKLSASCAAIRLAAPHLRWPSAYGVAMAARETLENGGGVSPQELDAVYLRKPQAERLRDRQLREQKKEL